MWTVSTRYSLQSGFRRQYMSDIRTLLFIDNNPAHAEAIRLALLATKDGPFHAEWDSTLSHSLERLRKNGVWAIFANLYLPDSQGLDTLDKLAHAAPGIPILVFAGADDEHIVTEVLRR